MVNIINAKLGPIKIYNDIIIAPVIRVTLNMPYLCAGPVFPDFDEKNIYRFYRFFKGECRAIDVQPQITEYNELIDEEAAYGGVAVNHFGHFIADLCVNRIIPILSFNPDMPFIINLCPPFKDLLPWQREILYDYLGIKKIIFVKDKPVLVRKLYISPQIEILNWGIYSSEYIEPFLDFLDYLTKKNILREKDYDKFSEKLFISRAKLPQKNTILGESYLVEVFKSLGYEIVYPEELSVKDQLKKYYYAKLLVFVEGSAMHALQLLGRLKNKTIIQINRRKGVCLLKNELKYRLIDSSVIYIDAVEYSAKIGTAQRMPSIINIEKFLSEFKVYEPEIVNIFDKDLFYIHCLKDFSEFLNYYANNRVNDIEVYKEIEKLINVIGINSFKGKKIAIGIEYQLKRAIKDDNTLKFLESICNDENNRNYIAEKLSSLSIQELIQVANVSFNKKCYRLSDLAYEKICQLQPNNLHAKIIHAIIPRGYNEIELSKKRFLNVLNYQISNKILNRTTIIQHLINKYGFKCYLEIGVARGFNFFQIQSPLKIGVDLKFNILGGYQNSENEKFFAMTSDEFFLNPPREIITYGIDLVFIDGLHTYEQSLRDVENSLKYLNPYGFIVLHDCLPASEAEAMPSLEEARKHPEFKGTWTGDVYKTIIHLRATRPDLYVVVVDVDHGVGIVRRGKPENILNFELEKIKSLSFNDFIKNKEGFLNLKSKEWFLNEFLLK